MPETLTPTLTELPTNTIAVTATPTPSAATPEPTPLSQQLETATAAVSDAPVVAEVPVAEPQWQGVRDYAKANGVDLPFDDDAVALQALIRSHQQVNQRDYYADLGRQVAPQAQQIAQYLAQQRWTKDAPVTPPPWQGPEFKKEWLQVVEKDENTGRLRSKAGYDPSIADKVQAYADWRESFFDNLPQNIGPLIQTEAQKLVDARFAQQNEQHQADQLISRNAQWLFQADAQGQAVYTPQGQRALTPEGVAYARATDSLWKAGMRDVRQIDAYARSQVENAVMRARMLQLQPPAANGSQLAAAAAQPSVGGQLARPSAAAPAVAQPTKGLSLREMLRVNLDRAGAPEDLNL